MCKDQAVILLVDDDTDDQEMLIEQIKKLEPSIIVKPFPDGKQVMEYLHNQATKLPCLIILDYNMPFLNGPDVLAQLAVLPHLQNVPKIVWSTSNSLHFQKECLQTGALKYIVKAYDMRTLKKIAVEMVDACCTAN